MLNCDAALSWCREAAPRLVCRLFQPCVSFIGRTVSDNAEHEPIDVCYAAEAKDAVSPETLQRIAEYVVFPRGSCVGGVEDKRSFRTQQTNGESTAAVADGKGIGDILAQNAIDPAFEDGRRLSPPVRMDDDNAVRRTNLLLVETHQRIARLISDQLVLWDYGIKMLAVQIVEAYSVVEFI